MANLIYGKIPPQATEIEQAVLGAIILERDKLEDILSYLHTQECFYDNANSIIYGAIRQLFAKGMPVDLLTVTEELRRTGELDTVGGAYYITQLTMRVVSSAHVEAHARIVKEKYLLREMIRIGGKTVSAGYEDATDVFELMETLHGEVYDLSTQQVKKDYAHISAVVKENQLNMEAQRSSDSEFTGVPTGFKDIDRLTRGWQNTDLIVLAARPGVGKTAFALNLALNAAKQGYPIAIFSLEMSSEQLEKRLKANYAGVELPKIIYPKLMSEAEYMLTITKGNELASLPIYVDDTAGLSMFELKSKARRMKKLHDIRVLIVDYLQLMKGEKSKNGTREQEISFISRELKVLAKDLDVPVIALSQLNRGVEARQDNKPKLSDLRESGAIEQDADIVGFLYRPSDEEIKQDASLQHLAYIDFQKHRNGSTEKLPLSFYGLYQRWEDIKPLDPFGEPPFKANAGMPTRLPYKQDDDDDAPF